MFLRAASSRDWHPHSSARKMKRSAANRKRFMGTTLPALHWTMPRRSRQEGAMVRMSMKDLRTRAARRLRWESWGEGSRIRTKRRFTVSDGKQVLNLEPEICGQTEQGCQCVALATLLR